MRKLRVIGAKKLRLGWGLQPPAGAICAFGARMIYDGSRLTYVANRSDRQGDPLQYKDAWVNFLNQSAMAQIREMIATYTPDPTSEHRYEIEFKIKGAKIGLAVDTKGSHGYLYVGAWLIPLRVTGAKGSGRKGKISSERDLKELIDDATSEFSHGELEFKGKALDFIKKEIDLPDDVGADEDLNAIVLDGKHYRLDEFKRTLELYFRNLEPEDVSSRYFKFTRETWDADSYFRGSDDSEILGGLNKGSTKSEIRNRAEELVEDALDHGYALELSDVVKYLESLI